GFVECVVRNNTGRPVKVPAAYVAGFDRELILKGDAPGFGWGLWLVRWRADTKPRHELLEPGKELCVFKAGLEILSRERAGVDHLLEAAEPGTASHEGWR